MNERIFNLSHSDICWSFSDNEKPYLNLQTKPYTKTEYVDPFPCYSHNLELVTELVEKFELIVNLKYKPKYFITPYESLSRTNGYASGGDDWVKNDKGDYIKNLNPFIVLHGKRICIMQSMTRYLVSHELAHVVHYNLENILKKDKNDVFSKEYAKEIRGIELNKSYGSQKWHTNINEIIANDIRIVLFNCEKEFWPHEVEHPDKNEKVQNYWKEMKEKYLT